MSLDFDETLNNRIGTYNNFSVKTLKKTSFDTSNFDIDSPITNIFGDLTVTGTIYGNINGGTGGNGNIGPNLYLSGTLGVAGASTLGVLSAGASNLSSANVSGNLTVSGATSFNNIMLYKRNLVTMGDSNFTPTPEELINGYFIQSGSMASPRNFALPHANTIVSIINNPIVGTSFSFTINNTAAGSNTRNLTGGPSQKMNIDNASSVNSVQIRNYVCIVTDVAIPAITVLDNHSLTSPG